MAKTLEEANAEIIELKEKLTEAENERDTFKAETEKLKTDNDEIRALNQKYFNKLNQQFVKEDEEEEPDEPEYPSCEEFAKNHLKI